MHARAPMRAGQHSPEAALAVAAMTKPGEKLSDLERRCLTQGITLTRQRHRILTTVAAAEAPMSVDEVWVRVRRQGDRVGRSTVNTMLGLMSQAGLVEMSYSETGTRLFR